MGGRLDPDLEAAAEEEIARACDLSWAQLARVVPWGDSYEGITPGGQGATYERGYLWAEGKAATCWWRWRFTSIRNSRTMRRHAPG